MMKFKGLTFAPDFQKRTEANFKNAQKFVDQKCIDLMEAYVPIAMPRFKNRGKMSRSHKTEKPGIIINTEPKARREYYINKGFSGGKRGKLWLERMKADHLDEIEQNVKEKFK